MIRILLVEDDPRLAALVRDFLQVAGGYQVEVEGRGDTAPERILRERPDLVVLDVMLPGKDGLTVCKEVRSAYHGPILMLSALGDDVDQIVGLEVGADDYVPKPASPRLLLARVKNLLARTVSPPSQELDLGWLRVDPAQRRTWVEGREVDLTTAEFDLLLVLAQHAGEPVERDDLHRELRGFEWDGLDRSIDLRVLRLRKKLGDDGRAPRWLKSVRGVGYLLVRP